MAMITLTSTNCSLTQGLSIERCNRNLKDASFSSYLNSTKESFVQKLAESGRDLHPVIPKGEDEDEEIGVFGAEKYFNGIIDHEESKSAPKIAKTMNPRKELQYNDDLDLDSAVRQRMQQSGTPSVGSESSWNSQSMLLNSIRRTDASQIKSSKKVNGKSFLGGLGCKCSCSDKNSVDIKEQLGELSFSSRTASSLVSVQHGKASSTKATIKSSTGPELDVLQVNKTHPGSWIRDRNVVNSNIDKMGLGSKRETNHVIFPALKSHETGKDFHMKIQFEKENDQDMQPRKSQEVFESPVYERRRKSLALDHHKRPTMLSSWDANLKVKAEIELSGGVLYTDCESDASSDLFELESLTGKADPYLKRQVSDVTLSHCVTPCHAPSEASIEWSVVTASAADFSTVCASDFEDQTTMPISSTADNNNTFLSAPYARMRENKNGHRKGGPRTLLGCNNQKAVEVAGDHHEYSRMRRRSDSFMPFSRFQAEYSKKHDSMSPSHFPVSRSPHA